MLPRSTESSFEAAAKQWKDLAESALATDEFSNHAPEQQFLIEAQLRRAEFVSSTSLGQLMTEGSFVLANKLYVTPTDKLAEFYKTEALFTGDEEGAINSQGGLALDTDKNSGVVILRPVLEYATLSEAKAVLVHELSHAAFHLGDVRIDEIPDGVDARTWINVIDEFDAYRAALVVMNGDSDGKFNGVVDDFYNFTQKNPEILERAIPIEISQASAELLSPYPQTGSVTAFVCVLNRMHSEGDLEPQQIATTLLNRGYIEA